MMSETNVCHNRVLCIDDDAEFLHALERRLKPYGIEMLRASCARDGFLAGLDSRPDCIITDMVMPAGDGRYLLGRFRAHIFTAGVPIIVVTGKRDASLRRVMLGLGVSAYLFKPLVFDALLDELRHHLDVPLHPQPDPADTLDAATHARLLRDEYYNYFDCRR